MPSCIPAGDIGAVLKLTGVNTGDTLCSPTRKVVLDGIDYPVPTLSMAVAPKNKGDEDKVAQGILRLAEEDPTIKFTNNVETHQMVISGLGEQHLDVVVSKLKSKFGVDVTLEKPRVAYRETIRKKVQVQGRHKKQTGGHGQFGDVWIEFEPCDSEGLEFGERVVGGSVPKGFFPAVEKGLRDVHRHGARWRGTRSSACAPPSTTVPTTRWTPPKWRLRPRPPWPIRPVCRRPPPCCWSPSAR